MGIIPLYYDKAVRRYCLNEEHAKCQKCEKIAKDGQMLFNFVGMDRTYGKSINMVLCDRCVGCYRFCDLYSLKEVDIYANLPDSCEPVVDQSIQLSPVSKFTLETYPAENITDRTQYAGRPEGTWEGSKVGAPVIDDGKDKDLTIIEFKSNLRELADAGRNGDIKQVCQSDKPTIPILDKPSGKQEHNETAKD